MEFDNIAQPWQRQQQNNLILPTKSNNRFFYKHHPKNWELYYFEKKAAKKTTRKPIWLPLLQTHRETPGVNGSKGFKNNPNSAMARTKLQDKGILVMNPSNYDYLRSYPARGGLFWVSKFTKLETIGNELIMTFDKIGYAHWRLELMANNKINLPHKQMLQKYKMEISRRIERHTRSQHIPEIAAKLVSLKETLNDMQLAINDIINNGVKHYEL